MSRAYLRVDPMLYERKVIDQGYPLPLFAAFVAVLCLAEHQPKRGRFRDVRVLRALLGPCARFVPELVRRCDLSVAKDGSLYVDGWEEWQEGDWKVGERVSRIRNRPHRASVTVASVTPVTVATVSTPSERSVIDSAGGGVAPLPPPAGGGTPRSNGTNPRAVAAALTRQANQAAKERKTRQHQRYIAYSRGKITEAQRIEMDEADTPLSQIPGWAS